MAKEPKFTTQYFYGSVEVTHYDAETTLYIAEVIRRAFKAENFKVEVKARWMYYNNGLVSIDKVLE